MPELQVLASAEPEKERKKGALLEVKPERAAKLPVGEPRAFLWEGALDRAPLEESELKE